MNRRWRTAVMPHPLLSLALAAIWLMLNESVAPLHVTGAVVLGILIPVLSRRFWPSRTPLSQPLRASRLLAVLAWDIVTANFAVARLVLNPWRQPRPRFVHVPLDLTDRFAMGLLANIASLTPGTVTVDVDPDAAQMLIHCLDVEDPQRLICKVKDRYEKPLKEIFRC